MSWHRTAAVLPSISVAGGYVIYSRKISQKTLVAELVLRLLAYVPKPSRVLSAAFRLWHSNPFLSVFVYKNEAVTAMYVKWEHILVKINRLTLK